MRREPSPPVLRHLSLAAGVALALVAGAYVVPQTAGPAATSAAITSTANTSTGNTATTPPPTVFRDALDQERSARRVSMGLAPDGHRHNHNDPRTKNDVSRSGETDDRAQDPTTPEQAAEHTAYVGGLRTQTSPPIVPAQARPKRSARYATTKYAPAGGCFALETEAGQQIGAPFRFQATDLATYLLYSAQQTFLATPGPTQAAKPGPAAEWVLTRSGRRLFSLRNGSTYLAARSGALRTSADPQSFRLRKRTGCARYPEAEVNITGAPFRGATPFQEVTGYADAHTHGMAFQFLGGAHCGRPWHKYGVAYALVDCPDHQTGVNPLESVLSGKPSHDPVGWPTFKDWPAPHSLTHEGVYWKWLERSWRGGQRLFVNLLVENNQLCRIYPFKRSVEDAQCDDMATIRREAQAMYDLQDYIDAQYGGPGKGFYRIVKNPFQARRVINDGKLAVIMGIETSVPFGCSVKLGVPTCTNAQIDQQLDEVHKLGVRQMQLVNKFDNGLSGVAGDTGEVGVVVNAANFLETGSYWDMRHCTPADNESADKTQVTSLPIDASQQDALFGAIAQIAGLKVPGVALPTVPLPPIPGLPTLPALPLYGPPLHCNERGLTPLGTHLINRLAQRNMLFDPDHMSWKARNAALDQVEALDYSGVLSSHSWSTPDAYPRIYRLGGFVAPYAGDSEGFVAKWRRHLTWADPRYYFGLGFGADINGLGAQGDPRGAGVSNPVTYPFTGLGGVQIDRNRAGRRTWDLNTDGVAHFGLYPDWMRDLELVAGPQDGPKIAADMARGAEAYLQTWERAYGIAADPCRNPNLRRTTRDFKRIVRVGQSSAHVLRAVGQPYRRVGTRFSYCTIGRGAGNVRLHVRFGSGKKVRFVSVIR